MDVVGKVDGFGWVAPLAGGPFLPPLDPPEGPGGPRRPLGVGLGAQICVYTHRKRDDHESGFVISGLPGPTLAPTPRIFGPGLLYSVPPGGIMGPLILEAPSIGPLPPPGIGAPTAEAQYW